MGNARVGRKSLLRGLPDPDQVVEERGRREREGATSQHTDVDTSLGQQWIAQWNSHQLSCGEFVPDRHPRQQGDASTVACETAQYRQRIRFQRRRYSNLGHLALQIDEPAADAAGCNRTYWALMAMRLTPALGFSAFGSKIVRTPFLNEASALSSSTSSSAICRSKAP